MSHSTPLPLGGPIEAMTRLVRYRGPDDEGYCLFSGPDLAPLPYGGADTAAEVDGMRFPYSAAMPPEVQQDAFVALGHRRLSILDLSAAGHQPMSTADLRYWLVYNGEVYNHRELRHELEAQGHAFLSRSDTEVILRAYAQWGEDCLRRFNGMFAFVLLDRVARRVFIARDRYGVKPLYLWRAPDGTLAAASEIKQFSALPGWAPKLNGQRAYDFLNWGLADHTGETLFADVVQLRGGEFVHCTLAQIAQDLPIRRWYELRPQPFAGSLDQAGREFRELFTDAVRIRLLADVPVGSCLSGGLDSSSIVCVANGVLREANAHDRQRTFSAGAEVKRYDETGFVEAVVSQTGVKAAYVYPSITGLMNVVDAICWHQDEPFGSTSIYAQWDVFGLAAQAGVKVLLDGQGADEVLAGYHGFFAPRFAGLLRSLHWAELWSEMRAAGEQAGFGLLGALKYLGNALLPEPVRQPLRRLAGKTAATPRWMNADRLSFVDRDPYFEMGLKSMSVNGMAHAMLTRTGVPMLLHWEDRNSMAHSIETRLPFLDYRLAEFALGLPEEFKLGEGTTKRVLRHAMRGILPEVIRARTDKMGFVTAEELWVREQAPDLFRAEMLRAVEASRGVINTNALERLECVIDGRERFSFLPWRIISFGRWMDRFAVGLPV